MHSKYSEANKVDELRMASDNVIPSHAAVNEVCVLQSLVINSVSDKIYSLSRSNTHSVLGLLLTIRTTLNRNLGMCFETFKFDDMLPTIHVYLLPKVKILSYFSASNFKCLTISSARLVQITSRFCNHANHMSVK